jgi:putative transposase
MRTVMVLDALEMTRQSRGTRLQGLVAHSDAGSQGGFDWSSQHLVMEVVGDDEQASAEAGGSGDEGEDVVAWAAFECAA